MHLDAGQRCGGWWTPRCAQPPAAAESRRRRRPDTRRRAVRRAAAEPGLAARPAPGWTPGWTRACWRPITFDRRPPRPTATTSCYVHLGHPLVQEGPAAAAPRAVQRGRRAAPGHRRGRRRPAGVVLWPRLPAGAGRPRRVAAARGGLPRRGPAARAPGDGRRNVPRTPSTQALDDAELLTWPTSAARTALVAAWNAPDSPLRARLLAAMTRRADGPPRGGSPSSCAQRQDADITRAREIFAHFRRQPHRNPGRSWLAPRRRREDDAVRRRPAAPAPPRHPRRMADAWTSSTTRRPRGRRDRRPLRGRQAAHVPRRRSCSP